MKFLNKLILPLVILLYLSACSTRYNESNISQNIILSDRDDWKNPQLDKSSDLIEYDWWKSFEDSYLDSIMDIFLIKNFDLKLAISSLESSRQLAIYNAGKILPDISIQGSNQKTSQNFDGSAFELVAGDEAFFSDTYGINISSQWEIDTWGKLYSKRVSSSKEFEASQNDYRYLKLSLIAQAAKLYFYLVESLELAALADSSFAANQDIFNIVERRYNQGVRSSLDYRLAKSNLLISESNLDRKKMISDNLKREMEVLIGVYPSARIETSKKLTKRLPHIPINLPSEVIKNRPDIVAAYNRIESSFSDLNYSKKMKLPSFNLTGSMGTSTEDLKNLLNGDFSVWNLGSNITLPIFQSGKIMAYSRLSKSLLEQAEINYIYSVLKAFSEIESKLYQDEMLKRQLISLDEAYSQSRAAYLLAKERYDKGLSDLITVLDSQKRMLDTNGQMISIQRLLIENRIDLLICLGGELYEFE